MILRPIPFSPLMVQALLEGRKTQTRRIIKQQPDERGFRSSNVSFEDWHGKEVKCPYGKVGDTLWVREEHYVYGEWIKNGLSKTNKQKWKFIPYLDGTITFKKPETVVPNNYRFRAWYKRLARFMPKKYARTYLKITDIRVERLQSISENDSISEGILKYEDGTYHNYFTQKGLLSEDGVECLLAKGSFQSLWSSINGQDSWRENPWVWVVCFEIITNH